jgi:hypothetical protein
MIESLLPWQNQGRIVAARLGERRNILILTVILEELKPSD